MDVNNLDDFNQKISNFRSLEYNKRTSKNFEKMLELDGNDFEKAKKFIRKMKDDEKIDLFSSINLEYEDISMEKKCKILTKYFFEPAALKCLCNNNKFKLIIHIYSNCDTDKLDIHPKLNLLFPDKFTNIAGIEKVVCTSKDMIKKFS